jgi:hypothetical protein
MGVVNFLQKVEQFVELIARLDLLKFNNCINVVVWYIAQQAFK